jgi:hypothetical protein
LRAAVEAYGLGGLVIGHAYLRVVPVLAMSHPLGSIIRGVAVLVAVATTLLIVAAWLASRNGVRAAAPILGSDVGVAGVASLPLLEDPVTRIRGRPDYLVRERRRRFVYPIELKPTRSSATLYDSDALQLAAYMLLTEAQYGAQFAGYGIVRYRSSEFRVAFTPELRRRCIAAAEGVRAARAAADVHRSHEVAAKCGVCAVRGACSEVLPLS